MDVLSLHPTPFSGVVREPDATGSRPAPPHRWTDRLRRLLAVDAGGSGGAGAVPTRRHQLLAYTAAEIVLGMGLLAITTVVIPVFSAIDPSLGGTALAGPGGGLILWVLFGLLGSVRTVSSKGGEGHFTFHLPFVGAATVLGGPTAGAWVAMLSTIERREIESQPWYGILANHAATVVAAVCAGLSVPLVDAAVRAVTGDLALARFVAIIGAALVMEVVGTLLAAITILLRDRVSRSGLLAIVIGDFGRDTAVEIALVWAFVVSYITVGWWAPAILGLLVILFTATPRREPPDPLTGLIRQPEFERQLGRKVGWMRRGLLDGATVMFLDLDGFKEVNDRYGHRVGDEVLAVIADRLRQACPRAEDLVSRLMGDEFGLCYTGLAATDLARAKAEQLLASICRPIATSVGPVRVGVSIGVVVVEAWGGSPSPAPILRWSEQAMYTAKRQAGECGGIHVYAPDDPTPFDATSREDPR